MTVVNLPSVENPNGMNVTVRGLLPVGMKMRDEREAQAGPVERAGQARSRRRRRDRGALSRLRASADAEVRPRRVGSRRRVRRRRLRRQLRDLGGPEPAPRRLRAAGRVNSVLVRLRIATPPIADVRKKADRPADQRLRRQRHV